MSASSRPTVSYQANHESYHITYKGKSMALEIHGLISHMLSYDSHPVPSLDSQAGVTLQDAWRRRPETMNGIRLPDGGQSLSLELNAEHSCSVTPRSEVHYHATRCRGRPHGYHLPRHFHDSAGSRAQTC